MCRAINLTSAPSATLEYYAKKGGTWESGDRVYAEISTTNCSSGFTTIQTHSTSISTGYGSFSIGLDSYVGQTVYLRFRGAPPANNTGEHFSVDTLSVTAGDSGASDGYLNGANPNAGRSAAPGKRERQMDMRTIEMAQAIKADGVDIFVVAFGVCQSNGTVYSASQCATTAAGGDIGNTDVDNTADQRLLKCVASSNPNSNDRYFYASSATALPSIFTAIANQIAHRLVE
jgi:hypothetical protein